MRGGLNFSRVVRTSVCRGRRAGVLKAEMNEKFVVKSRAGIASETTHLRHIHNPEPRS
jgi:hypothetical protein